MQINIRSLILPIIASLTLACSAQTNAADSTAVKYEDAKSLTDSIGISLSDTLNLSEVTVTARNMWVENGKVMMIPSKHAKNLARNISSMIDLMDTSVLKVKNGQIQTISGQDVNIFINGEPVDKVDSKTFWAKNVLRVEYIPTPFDSQYEGKNNVVNIVMKEYAVGGLTQFDGFQTVPNYGYYSVSSKLVYKKMTFNASAEASYDNNNFGGTDGYEYYDGVWYNGTKYDRISRISDTHTKSRSNSENISMNARYSSGNFTATHRASFDWKRSPENSSRGALYYTPDIIKSEEMRSLSSSKSPAAVVSGEYRSFFKNRRCMIVGRWSASYSHNNNSSALFENPEAAIITDIKEDSWNGMAGVNAAYQFNSKMYMTLNINEVINDYSTRYSGTTESRQNLRRYTTDVELLYNWRPVDVFSMQISPRMKVLTRNINDAFRKTEVMPSISLQGSYDINSKNSLGLYANCEIISPETSVTNDLILRQTELRWLEGNPLMKTQSLFYVSPSYTWIPVNWFNTSVSGLMMLSSNESVLDYRAGGVDFDGIIGSYTNGLHAQRYGLSWNTNIRLFNGKLTVGPSLQYINDHVKYITSHDNLSFSVRSAVNLGNWRISAFYDSPRKSLTNASGVLLKIPADYGFEGSYGNGNIRVSVFFKNVFSSRICRTQYYNSPVYSYSLRNWNRGFTGRLSLSYTFDYGKKVDPGIDINKDTNRSTSVLGSK